MTPRGAAIALRAYAATLARAAWLRDRAALLARLGFTPAAATARLTSAVAWDFDPPSAHGGPHRRPAELGDAAIAALVDDVFKRQRG